MKVTEPQLRVLRILADEGTPRGGLSAFEVARFMWPDSDGWKKQPRRHDGRAGGLGATMPMKAGTILNRLWTRELVGKGAYVWSITDAGRSAIGCDT